MSIHIYYISFSFRNQGFFGKKLLAFSHQPLAVGRRIISAFLAISL
jgi:hypothetical protein